ncbi:MAG: hypothetical protein II684_02160 [Treponema sp.]|nr:hypothetical protein [Treponema sp.]
MEETMKKSILILFVTGLLLSACSRKESIATAFAGGEEESENFVTEALPVHGKEDLITDVMYVRFYDGNRNIPYVSVEYFLQECAEFLLENSAHSGKKHIYENKIKGNKFSLLVDAEKDVIYCPEWYGYAGLSGKTSEERVEDNELIQKILRRYHAFSGQKPLTIDLHKYGLKIYSGIDDSYIPLCVMNNLFTSFEECRFVYNGKNIYAVMQQGEGPLGTESYPSFSDSPWFTNEDGSLAERPKELIDLNYNLLCLTHDYLYGKPGYYGFADDGSGYANLEIAEDANKLEFDAMLQKYAPETRNLLKSSSYREYFDGLLHLILYVYGDCHSSQRFLNFFPKAAYTEEEAEDMEKNKFKSPVFNQHFSNKWKKCIATQDTLAELCNKAKMTSNIERLKDKKTAVIRFDGFRINYSGWKSLYEKSPLPNISEINDMPADTLGLFATAFQLFQNNKEFKDVSRVIFDLSINGGGDKLACQKVLTYITGKGDMYTYDVHTQTKNHEYVQTVDMNLDGKCDLEDIAIGEEIRKKYKFAVLTSFNSFSCGNYFPVACADNGIPIIGERSSGGSCVVGYACTAEGFLFRYSASYHLCHTDWTSVENGAPVTKELKYEQFYDQKALEAVMDELFN